MNDRYWQIRKFGKFGVSEFFANRQPALVAMEACGSASC
jgi:hypothetical protein